MRSGLTMRFLYLVTFALAAHSPSWAQPQLPTEFAMLTAKELALACTWTSLRAVIASEKVLNENKSDSGSKAVHIQTNLAVVVWFREAERERASQGEADQVKSRLTNLAPQGEGARIGYCLDQAEATYRGANVITKQAIDADLEKRLKK